jgi:hypothetical protein
MYKYFFFQYNTFKMFGLESINNIMLSSGDFINTILTLNRIKWLLRG